MLVRFSAALMIALVTLLSACSSAHGGRTESGADSGVTDLGIELPDAANPIPSGGAQACSHQAAAQCARLDACTNGTGVARRYGDMNTCLTRELNSCLYGITARDTTQDPMRVEACAAAIPMQSCADYFANQTPAACIAPSGPRQNGAVCSYRAQCQSGWCNVSSHSACGTCGGAPLEGDSCATQSCGHGLLCVAGTLLCAAPVGASGACDSGHPCATGYSCVGAVPADGGVCVAQGDSVGVACQVRTTTTANCNHNDGYFCTSPGHVCATASAVSTGQVCGSTGTEDSVCQGGSGCVVPDGGTTGTCSAVAADGETCDIVTGPTCMSPSRCVVTTDGATTGTCMFPDGLSCN